MIGAAVRGAAGAIIGKKMDKQKKELEEVLPEDTKVEVVEEEGQAPALKVTFDSGILFATNSSTVSEASKSALRNLPRPPGARWWHGIYRHRRRRRARPEDSPE